MGWGAKLGQAAVFSLLGYAFPRFLVALGIPLDAWINAAGQAMDAPYLNFNSALWGFTVVFAILMLWAEGRFTLFERMFAAARPIKLTDDQINSLTMLLRDAEDLINEGLMLALKPDWQQRVVQWNMSVEDFIRQSLPPVELISYSTVNLSPSVSQVPLITHTSLQGRRYKLRRMTMRLLPTHWSRRGAIRPG